MPSEHVPEIPVELEHMILSAMAPDPSDRPTALELQSQLATFCGAGTKHASSAHSLAPWLKDLLGEEQEAYETYASSNPSMTPLPRSANLPPTKHAIEAKHRKGKGLNGVIAILGLAAAVLAGVLVMIVLRKHRPEPPRRLRPRKSLRRPRPYRTMTPRFAHFSTRPRRTSATRSSASPPT
jgi:hypothetical protein